MNNDNTPGPQSSDPNTPFTGQADAQPTEALPTLPDGGANPDDDAIRSGDVIPGGEQPTQQLPSEGSSDAHAPSSTHGDSAAPGAAGPENQGYSQSSEAFPQAGQENPQSPEAYQQPNAAHPQANQNFHQPTAFPATSEYPQFQEGTAQQPLGAEGAYPAAGAGQYPAGTGQYPTGAEGAYPSAATGQFPVAAGDAVPATDVNEGAKKSNVGKIIGGIIAAAVLLPCIAGLAIFLLFGGSGKDAGDASNVEATASETPTDSKEATDSSTADASATPTAADDASPSESPAASPEADKPEAATATETAEDGGSAADGDNEAGTAPVLPGPKGPATGANESKPAEPTGSAGVTEAAAEKALVDAAIEGEGVVATDGSFVAQLSSKYPGIKDESRTSADGDHVFSANDIVEEYKAYYEEFGGNVVLVRATHFGKQIDYPGLDDANRMFVILYNGKFDSRASAEAWCKQAFPGLSGDQLNNNCYVREAKPPHN